MDQAIRSLLGLLVLAILLAATTRARDLDPPREPDTVTTQPPARSAIRSPASFTREMPLSEAIDTLRNATSPPLNLVVLWRDLAENAGVYRDTPIGIDGVPGLRIGQYLDLLVLSLSAGAAAKVDWIVNGGVVTVGTVDALPKPKSVTRVYDISDLVAPPAQYFIPLIGLGGMGGYGGQIGTGNYGGGMGAGYGSSPMMGGGFGTGGLGGFVGNLYGGVGSRPMPYGR